MGLMDRLRARKAETVDVELQPWRLMAGARVRVDAVDPDVLTAWTAVARSTGSGHEGDVQVTIIDGVPTVFHDGRRLGVFSEQYAHYYVEPLRRLQGSGYFGLVSMWSRDGQATLRIMRGVSPLLVPANQPPDGVAEIDGDEWEVVREDAAALKQLVVKGGERSAWFLVRRDGDRAAAFTLDGRRVGYLSQESTPHALHALGALDVACIPGAVSWHGATPQLALG